jgi:CDP-paratose 2-epimerase
MTVLITGSWGLVGSEAVKFFLNKGDTVVGIDNNMRRYFFGADGDVRKDINNARYAHFELDIRVYNSIKVLMERYKPELIIHTAAQPSHDWAAKEPLTDFGVNADGTLNMLEATRQIVPEAVFIYVSTNKVYGDNPNKIPLFEGKTRYSSHTVLGIDETMQIDNCLHSLFGVSKLSGDLLAQEYGKYFGMKTGIFRCGCITGKAHAAAELHGFLAYMVRCKKEKRKYNVFGYKGKQVRDNIHAFDLVNAFYHFSQAPRCGEVYNMGGGSWSNISVLEAIERLDIDYEYKDEARKGDHIWYISDVKKFRNHYPKWKYKYDIDAIFEDLGA